MADLNAPRRFDLAQQSVRELNGFLHKQAAGEQVTHVRIDHPDGAHSVACGLDAPLDVQIHGHVGYYVAGMNKHASVTIYGNAGPGIILGPGQFNFDISILKTTIIRENHNLQFRAEFFNLTNTPNFSLPGFGNNGVSGAPGALDYTSTTFGQINSTRDGQNDQREIQFALKFYY